MSGSEAAVRVLSIRHARAGMILGEDVLAGAGSADGVPLLRAGTTLTAGYLHALRAHGVHAIYVEDRASAGIRVPKALDPQTRKRVVRAVAKTLNAIKQRSVRGATTVTPGELRALTAVSAQISASLAASVPAGMALADLAAFDSYTYEHSVNSTALGLMIGDRLMRRHGYRDWRGRRSFDGIETRLVRLGVGLLLHDVGMLAVPSEIMRKDGPLSADEMAVVRRHPLAGCDMLAGDTVPPLVRAVIRSHHERWDGGGYPDGKSGEQINQLARVASIADAYHAIISTRAHARARPPDAGWHAIAAGGGTQFDPQIGELFCELIAPWPVGSEVLLNDGRRAIVAACPEGRLQRPSVRIIEGPPGEERPVGELHLLDHPGLSIVRSIEHDEPAAHGGRHAA